MVIKPKLLYFLLSGKISKASIVNDQFMCIWIIKPYFVSTTLSISEHISTKKRAIIYSGQQFHSTRFKKFNFI